MRRLRTVLERQQKRDAIDWLSARGLNEASLEELDRIRPEFCATIVDGMEAWEGMIECFIPEHQARVEQELLDLVNNLVRLNGQRIVRCILGFPDDNEGVVVKAMTEQFKEFAKFEGIYVPSPTFETIYDNMQRYLAFMLEIIRVQVTEA